MKKGHIYTYYGLGKGKTTLAVGQGLRILGEENTVVMVQFLDSHESKEFNVITKLEPDFRVFKYGEYPEGVNELSEAQEKELASEVSTGFIIVKKFIETGECDMLILDGILDAVNRGFLNENELCDALRKKESYMDIIMTGEEAVKGVIDISDFVYSIKTEKYTEIE